MESLEIEEPELADEIRKKMFVFEDILLLDDRAIQRVLRDVENADLELALKNTTEEVQNVIYKNLSKRLAASSGSSISRDSIICFFVPRSTLFKMPTIASIPPTIAMILSYLAPAQAPRVGLFAH